MEPKRVRSKSTSATTVQATEFTCIAPSSSNRILTLWNRPWNKGSKTKSKWLSSSLPCGRTCSSRTKESEMRSSMSLIGRDRKTNLETILIDLRYWWARHMLERRIQPSRRLRKERHLKTWRRTICKCKLRETWEVKRVTKRKKGQTQELSPLNP